MDWDNSVIPTSFNTPTYRCRSLNSTWLLSCLGYQRRECHYGRYSYRHYQRNCCLFVAMATRWRQMSFLYHGE